KTIRSTSVRFLTLRDFPRCTSSNMSIRTMTPTGGFPTVPAWKPCCVAPGSRSSTGLRKRFIFAGNGREVDVVEAVMLWNEPNNLWHWDFEMDPEWNIFSDMVKQAARAVQAENSKVTRAMGGISPIDPNFVARLGAQGALGEIDVVAVHG